MNPIYLKSHDTKQNMHRFFQMFVTPSLFDDWSLIKEWAEWVLPVWLGRNGLPQNNKQNWPAKKSAVKKLKRGYCLK